MAFSQTLFFRVILLLCFAFSNTFVSGQQVSCIQLDVDDGLPSNYVYRVVQDRQGYIWMATNAGVARFDGQRFELYTTKDGLTNNDVLNMQEDSRGRLWFLTLAGGFCYYKDGQIHNSQTDPWLAHGPKRSFQASFFEDSQENLWFISRHEGIFCVREDTTLKFDVPGVDPKVGVGGMWEDKNQNILIQTVEEVWQLYPELKLMQGGLPPFSLVGAGLPFEGGLLSGDYEGNLLHVTDTGQVNRGSLTRKRRAIFIRELADSCIWVTSLAGGVDRMKRSADGSHLERAGFFFPENIVTSVLQDKEGNVWFSTQKSGAYMMRPHKIYNYPKFKGLGDMGVQRIFRDSKGWVWLSADKKILARGASLEDNFLKSRLLAGMEFNGVLEWKADEFIAYGSGVMKVPNGDPRVVFLDMPKIDGNKKRKLIYKGRGDFLLFSDVGSVKKMIIDKSGQFWGAGNTYLFRFDPELDDENAIKVLKKGRFSSIAEGQDGAMWVARSDGLFAYDKERLVSYQDVHPAFSGAVVDLAFSKSTGLWVATNGEGLINFQPETGETRSFTMAEGLAGNLCQGLTLVEGRFLWVSTKSGLSRIDLVSGYWDDPSSYIFTLGRDEGLLSNEVSSIYVEGDTVMACTPKGISVFHFKEASRRLPSPPLFINGIQVGDSLHSVDGKLSFSHKENSPTFSFTALSYGSLDKMHYEYRLHPLETKWNHTPLQKAIYNQLQPGAYTFEVRAFAKDGTPSKGLVEVDFTIREAWWQTWFFNVFMGLLISLLIWGAIMWRFRNRSRRIELERKFLESERKALRAQMNPHFIFNSLNSIQNFLAKNDRKAAYTYLARFGKLMRSILENSDKTYVTVEEELTVLKLYLQMESLRADHQFTYEFQIDSDVHPGSVFIPPMLLQPYVENAIWHGVMPLKSGGHIGIFLNGAKDGLFCRIQDNGVGRAASAKSGHRDQEKRSFGTRITEERLSLLNDQAGKKLAVSTIDLKDDTGKALGTRVELFVPYIQIESNS